MEDFGEEFYYQQKAKKIIVNKTMTLTTHDKLQK